MLNALLHAAVLTLLVQEFLFPLLLAGSLYWTWRALTEKTKPGREKSTARASKDEEGARVEPLRPLKCQSCGAGVPLRAGESVCPSCGAAAPVPPHYAEIGRLRAESLSRLRLAARYLRRAAFLSSGLVRGALFAAALWLFVIPFFLLIAGSEFRYYDPLLERLGLWFQFSFGTLIVWIIVLSFTAGMMTKVRRVLPTFEGAEKAGEAETAACATCGGAVAYERGDLATVCGYCGVETYRVRVAWRARDAAKRGREEAGASLVGAMQAARGKVEDLIAPPAILIFIFVVCPFLLLVVPYYVYDYFTDHPLVFLSAFALILAAVHLLRRLRRS